MRAKTNKDFTKTNKDFTKTIKVQECFKYILCDYYTYLCYYGGRGGGKSESFFIPMDGVYFGATKEDFSLIGIHSANDLFSSRLNWSSGMGVKLNHKSLTFQEVEILYENPFNAGFMLVNLALWRERHLEEKLIDFFKTRDSLF